MATVILLGAGASYASEFKLPTMDKFFDDPQLPPKLKGFLEDFYWSRPAHPDESEQELIERNRARYNLEEVLTHLHLTELREEKWTGKRRGYPIGHEFSYKELLDYIPRRLDTPADKVCKLHESLFLRLDPQDSVLTLNYDLVADAALHHVHPRMKARDAGATRSRTEKLWKLIGSEFSVPSEARSVYAGWVPYVGGHYLKLHGSIDWMRCSEESCENHAGYRPHGPAAETAYPASTPTVRTWQALPNPACPRCGSLTVPFIVPPVPSKTEAISARVQLMWTTALQELRAAQRVLVVGVSLAPSDVDLRWLLRTAAQHRNDAPTVAVVNPCSESRRRCLELFGANWIWKQYSTLDSYLEGVTVDD